MISVIIPSYNRGYIIKRSLESILNQTYKNIEVLVIDDNSNDNTYEVVNSIKDSRIRYIKLNENNGACYARNYGVRLAKGEYIAFQDSDDIWYENKLEKQLEYLDKNKLDIVSCKMYIHQDKKNNIVFPRSININKKSIYFENFISTQLLLGKKECFIKDPFNTQLPRFQDWELAIRLVDKYNIGILNEILCEAYIQENSISRNPQKAIEALEIIKYNHSVSSKVKANYTRLISLYKMQNGEPYKKGFYEALFMNPLDKKIIFDFIISLIGSEKYHYEIYKKRGRF